jgi:hypothetical protein
MTPDMIETIGLAISGSGVTSPASRRKARAAIAAIEAAGYVIVRADEDDISSKMIQAGRYEANLPDARLAAIYLAMVRARVARPKGDAE